MSGQPGLPKHFVNSMRTLFDIMDDRKCGYVKFSDIESRWKDDDANKRLPRGVLECLSRVTPPNGLLSFERFCAGLKICLLRNRAASNNGGTADNLAAPPTTTLIGNNKPRKSVPSQSVSPTVNNHHHQHQTAPTTTTGAINRPTDNGSTTFRDGKSISSGQEFVVRSVPVSPSKTSVEPTNGYRTSNTATVRPNLSLQQRALSMPLLGDNKLSWCANGDRETVGVGGSTSTNHLSGPDGNAIYEPNTNTNYPATVGTNQANFGGRSELRGYKSETMIPSTAARGPGASSFEPTNHRDRPNPLIGGAADRLPPSRSALVAHDMANSARNRRGIMTVLHNWHLGLLNDAAADQGRARSVHFKVDGTKSDAATVESQPPPKPPHLNQQPATAFEHGGGAVSDGDVNTSINKEEVNNFRRGHPRRREPRRHTLANGIDYNMLKRMKQLEQEKDVLLQGREAVERARSWYAKQILGVQEKMKCVGQNNGYLEYSTEAHQERLNFQMAQIFEANQHLANLVESSERGFPIHMNLAVRQPSIYAAKTRPPPPAAAATTTTTTATTAVTNTGALHQLKEINHLLSQEVSKKSERIAQLEKEKAALVRELFQARSQGRREVDDTTLM